MGASLHTRGNAPNLYNYQVGFCVTWQQSGTSLEKQAEPHIPVYFHNA